MLWLRKIRAVVQSFLEQEFSVHSRGELPAIKIGPKGRSDILPVLPLLTARDKSLSYILLDNGGCNCTFVARYPS